MTIKKVLPAIILVALCLTSLIAAGRQEEENPGDESMVDCGSSDAAIPGWLVENTAHYITIIDSVGNEVTISKPVNTLISNAMGEAFATLRALKAQEMVLASCEYVTRNEAFFPVIANLPSISMGMSVDSEMILALNPDFICVDPDFYAQLDEAVISEIPIVQLQFNTTESISLLGAILGREEEAADFIEWVRGYTDMVDERIAKLSEKDLQDVFVYYGGQYGMSSPPPYGTFGKGDSSRNDLIRRAGGRSLSQDVPGDWIAVDPEWVIEKNPSMIIRECFILSDHPEMGYGVDGDTRAKALMENIVNQPAFELSDAVKNGNVHMIYGDLVNDSWFVSLLYMAKWFHPGLFEDIDPQKMHQEFITWFQGLNSTYGSREFLPVQWQRVKNEYVEKNLHWNSNHYSVSHIHTPDSGNGK